MIEIRELKTFDKVNELWISQEFLWPDSDNIGWSVCSDSSSQIDEILPLIPNKRIAIQAGGNGGIWPIKLAKNFDHVITFEPGATMFDCLTKNVELHEVTNITTYHAALSDTSGTLNINVHNSENLGASWIVERIIHDINHDEITAETVTAMRLDDLSLEHCDLIQLDAEGYEMFILQGASELISKFKPAIMLEINECSTAYGFSNDDVMQYITSLGYSVAKKINDNVLFLPTI